MNDFVKYLNGLHNYNAQNQNAYGEKNVQSPYYERTQVPIDVCQHIINLIEKEEPHIIILTGHAGDGKTSIMYQVLKQFGVDILSSQVSEQPITEISTESGKILTCIKDFSELSEEKRLSTLNQLMVSLANKKYGFTVANTGPLINTFGALFRDEKEQEQARMDIIDAMDSNTGAIRNIHGYPMAVINVAAIENTGFAERFLSKIQAEDLWEKCELCNKKSYCHIWNNHRLILDNKDRVYEFIRYYYIWQTEYGTRLTIRSMTEHLAYIFTGGDGCEDVKPGKLHKKLFSNLFFGYEGIISNPLAENIIAVRLAKESNIYLKRLRADEELLIRRNYKHTFGSSVNEVISDVDTYTALNQEWDNELRRMYLFMSIVPDEQHKKDIEDIFSRQFYPYYMVRNENTKPIRAQKDLVIDALRMIYTGTVSNSANLIPITMSSEGGISQSVQLIAGTLNTGDIDIRKEPDSDMNKGKNNLYLKIKKIHSYHLTLPMLDHFAELRDGVIATNIDPQLSHGIENLKATILSVADIDEDRLDMLVMSNSGYTQESIVIENGIIELQ